jgi:hypothetical protein
MDAGDGSVCRDDGPLEVTELVGLPDKWTMALYNGDFITSWATTNASINSVLAIIWSRPILYNFFTYFQRNPT